MSRQGCLLSMVLLGAVLAGCASRSTIDVQGSPEAVSAEYGRNSASTTFSESRVVTAGSFSRTIGYSVEDRPIVCHILGTGPEVVLIIATIHGSEPAGTPLAERLREELMRRPDALEGRKVLLVPVANPDGLAKRTRSNVRGVDLNRNFPADNWRQRKRNGSEPLSEPESEAVYRLLIEYHPARIVSIHQPLACVDYDGPAKELAQTMADLCGLPVRKLGGRPGSFGSHAGVDLGIPIVTLELPGSASRLGEDELWQKYGQALLAAVAHR